MIRKISTSKHIQVNLFFCWNCEDDNKDGNHWFIDHHISAFLLVEGKRRQPNMSCCFL